MAANNRYDRSEWAGAFGDLGTLIPFVVGYISILGMDPLGILLGFGIFLIASGLYYKTPLPVQPMKAIGAAAMTQGTLIGSGAIWSAGLFSGLFWLILGLSGVLKFVSKIVSKPVIRGIVLGLGLSFILTGTRFMGEDLLIAILVLLVTLVLLRSKRIPVMFVLLIFGVILTLIRTPEVWQALSAIRPSVRVPRLSLNIPSGREWLSGIFVLAIPQIPLSLGNAIIATTAENNRLFPDRPVSERKLAVSQGIMNLIAPLFGGVPMCHGAGGMAAHVRFGARTGGSIVISGSVLLLLGLFFSDSVLLLFGMIPPAVLGVILSLTGLELVLSARDVGRTWQDLFVLFITAGFSLWNVGIGFLAGLLMQEVIKRWVAPAK